ncbi:hypothetical protein BJY04DRAFT_201418 [Aspergillus karnatakaensis]|uniref:uncharacterized protein n=1 Tax=Aspergillus karnatakaensis TaxID=1810916 RepID=UPI003CCDCFFE
MDADSCQSQVQSPLRTFIDVLIAILIAASYTPQFKQLRARDRTSDNGISGWYITLLTISATTHFAARIENVYSQEAYDCTRYGDLRGLRAFSALVIYIQPLVQWVAAVSLLAVYLRDQTDHNGEYSPIYSLGGLPLLTVHDTDTDTQYSLPRDRHATRPLSKRTIIAAITSHAAIVFPIAIHLLFSGRSDDSSNGYNLRQGLHVVLAITGLFTSLIAALPQVYLLIHRTRAGLGVGSLSLLGLALQAFAFAALAGSQAVRLGWPARRGSGPDQPLTPLAWWWDINGTAVGYAALAVCQLLVLKVAIGASRAGGSGS